MDNFSYLNLAFVLRVLMSGICGAVIGIERSNRSKNAGVRTHCIVAVGAALMMIISKYGFADTVVGQNGIRGADSARIAAQVVSGIGFLGAGMIFVHKNSITGLTTAAGIWTTSGIGLAMGAGMYVISFAVTATVVVVQILFHKNFRWLKTPAIKTICIDNVECRDYQKIITQRLKDSGINVTDTAAEKTDGDMRNYRLTAEIPDYVTEDDILDMIEYNCRIKNSIE